MMVQQIRVQSTDVSFVKTTGSKQEGNTDQFHSMLQTVAQKTTSKADVKNKSADKTRNKTSEQDTSDKTSQEQMDAVQTVQMALQDATVLQNAVASGARNETNSFIQDSALSENNLTPEMSVEKLQMLKADIGTEVGEKLLFNEMGQKNNTASAEAVAQTEVGLSDSVSAAEQILAEKQMNDDGLAVYQTDSTSHAGQVDAYLSVKSFGDQPSPAAGENRETNQNQNFVTVEPNAQTVMQEKEMSSSSAKSNTGEILETHNTFQKLKHAEGNSGTNATESLSNLYNSGNVVIRVSNEIGQERASPIRQIADTAIYQMQNGKKEFTVDLYPESLGKVSVKLISDSGMLTVEIAASNPKTQSLILSSSAEIRDILQAATAQNVQTVIPNHQAAQWNGQPQDNGGDSNGRRQKQENPRRHGLSGIKAVSSELHTEDFLTMMQQIGAYAR
ncbi:MAG: hypothetical protein ACFWUC_01510 [Oscillospiraceae bacterium]|jgi:flagellar hook-length control protein FliK